MMPGHPSSGSDVSPADNSRQTWDSKSYQRDTGFVSKYGENLLDWLNLSPNEKILDLGCGDGALTQKLVEMGGDVVGVDASPSFVKSAQERGLDVRLMDGHSLTFSQQFDAVFSNAALHWMLEPEKVLEGVSHSLKPGGRFVGEFGGYGNVAAISVAMRAVGHAMGGDTSLAGPWFFPTVEQYGKLLQQYGFSIEIITSYYRPTPLPTGMEAWLYVMRAPFFDQFGERKDEVMQQVLAALAPSLQDYQGNWIADYVRLKFCAVLK